MGEVSSLQNDIDCISQWAQQNIMNLNPKKCKIMTTLKRAGVPSADLVTIYSALVRSVLEYSSVVWATCLPRFLIDQLEAIQKRALRIVYPDLHYQQALAQANITSLEYRRAHLCLKVWHNIKNNPACQLHRLLPTVRSECHSHHISSRFQYRTKCFGLVFSQQWRKSTNQ